MRTRLMRAAALASVGIAGMLLCRAAADQAAFRPVDAGGRSCPIVLGAGATRAERTAADELADYLTRITGVPFRVFGEGELPERASHGPAIWVGPTTVARRHGLTPERFDPEGWRLRQAPDGLIVIGGRPRGTLYAAYRLLEDHLGVRWWTPFEEDVPHDPRPSLGPLDDAGRPVFAVRNMNSIPGPAAFRARSRLNGHHADPGPAYGGAERYGPPHHTHTYALHIPAEEFGQSHPEYFALIDGERRPGQGQLCTTSAALRAELLLRLRASIELGRASADAEGRVPPTVYEISPNDRGGYCECETCRAAARRHGGQAGLLLELVSTLASAIAETDPDVRLSTLAYYGTVRPPDGPRLPPNVVVRFSDLQAHDFLRPLSARRHRASRSWLDGWLALSPELRVWTYGVSFGSGRGLPLPNLGPLADDLRLFAERGVHGVYVQFDHPELSDMRALKGWVIPRLLEDPSRELDRLVVEFTDGYYGAAGPPIRRALALVERAAVSATRGIRYPARRSQFEFLDAVTIRRVQRQFERAERAVRADAQRLERVRRARMSIDRATLARGAALVGDRRSWAWGGAPFDLRAVAERLRRAWSARIEQRVPPADRPRSRAEMDRELQRWSRGDAGVTAEE